MKHPNKGAFVDSEMDPYKEIPCFLWRRIGILLHVETNLILFLRLCFSEFSVYWSFNNLWKCIFRKSSTSYACMFHKYH